MYRAKRLPVEEPAVVDRGGGDFAVILRNLAAIFGGREIWIEKGESRDLVEVLWMLVMGVDSRKGFSYVVEFLLIIFFLYSIKVS